MRLGYMSQKFDLYGELSVKQNMEFFAGAYGLFGKTAKDRIAKLAKEFQLVDVIDRAAKTLPGGVKQRLAMAVALLHRPSILFLDEPTSGADVPTRRQFWRWMTALAAQGTTIIVTTHFMEEALYCDRLLIQDAGQSVVLGTPQEVRGEAATMEEAFIRIVEKARVRRGEAS
jgi:ABC-2 type transport system ATP-binding protein